MSQGRFFFKALNQNFSLFCSYSLDSPLHHADFSRYLWTSFPSGWRRSLSRAMKRPAKRKCRHCKEFFRPDPRNRHHQRYCSKPACRRQSKAEAQRRWLQKPDNQSHFRGPENRQRVQAWRKAPPGYWRKGKPKVKRPLQDLCAGQSPENEQLTKKTGPLALQDLLRMQPALVVGLISMMTGSALQEDIAEMVRRLQRKGQDILGANATRKPS
jgi:hypothetical protein